jgi:NAD(P)-dependent dehydrogenase (short-subunit alcohol dehydrogenase family)
MGKLDGKVAIVTGAARGLGRAYAKRLAGLGAKIAVTDLNLRSYEEFEAEAKDMTADSTVAEIEATGGTALGIEVDATDHEAVNAMAARVVQEGAGLSPVSVPNFVPMTVWERFRNSGNPWILLGRHGHKNERPEGRSSSLS